MKCKRKDCDGRIVALYTQQHVALIKGTALVNTCEYGHRVPVGGLALTKYKQALEERGQGLLV